MVDTAVAVHPPNDRVIAFPRLKSGVQIPGWQGDQDKSWAPHVVCSVCVEELRQWFKVQGFNLKNRKDISYPTILRSAIRPVAHGPNLPIPSPPDTPDNILDQISPISSDSDDGYDPGTNVFSQSDWNDLVRDPPKEHSGSFRV
ncbi:uncharacterized protein TNCV_4781781 [Trichonephila clavipes]|nr:uncharacterized protein TNCV_4781781 [Trichonephila clavipes]